MEFGCRKCNRCFERLKALKKIKFCGDFYKCTDCDNDITRDPETVAKESREFARKLWNVTPNEEFEFS